MQQLSYVLTDKQLQYGATELQYIFVPLFFPHAAIAGVLLGW